MTQIQTIPQIRKDAAAKQAVYDDSRRWGAPVADFVREGLVEYISSEIAEWGLRYYVRAVTVYRKSQIWVKIDTPFGKKRKLLKITSDDEKLDKDLTRILKWAKEFGKEQEAYAARKKAEKAKQRAFDATKEGKLARIDSEIRKIKQDLKFAEERRAKIAAA